MLGQEYPDVIYLGPPNGYRKDDGNPVVTDKRWITIHNTANTADARAEASWARRRPDKVSSHYYADPAELVQTLNTAYCANHVGSDTGNLYGISYELTGTNARTTAWWLENLAWDLVARQIARDCLKHRIPPRVLTLAQLRAGEHGIITHDMARQAWGSTDHTDPGRNFPLAHLESLVRQQIDGGKKMLVITKDEQGRYWLSDGIVRREILADPTAAAGKEYERPIKDLHYLSDRGVIGPIFRGNLPGAAVDGIWQNTSPAFGVPITGAAGPAPVVTDEQLERVLRKIARSVPA